LNADYGDYCPNEQLSLIGGNGSHHVAEFKNGRAMMDSRPLSSISLVSIS